MACPDCDAMLTRLAVLALTLRKFGVWAHREAGHPAANWQHCDRHPCVTVLRALEQGTLPEDLSKTHARRTA